jgi:hypothetical protein
VRKSNQPDPNVRHDLGGWLSGPSLDPPLPPPRRDIPPNSTAHRELLTTIVRALELPAPATTKDELTYLRLSRDRARCCLWACKTALTRDTDDLDLMATVVSLREQLADYPADSYDANPLSL